MEIGTILVVRVQLYEYNHEYLLLGLSTRIITSTNLSTNVNMSTYPIVYIIKCLQNYIDEFEYTSMRMSSSKHP